MEAGAAGFTALVVDDSRVARRVAARALELAPMTIDEVLEAPDAETALGLLERGPVSLALVDLHMQGMGGLAFVQMLRSDAVHRRVPILVVSSDDSADNLVRVRELGARFLRKPYTPESLVREVLATLDAAPHRAHDQTLYDVTARLLDTVCFLLPDEDGGDSTSHEEVTVCVHFEGWAEGELVVGYAGIDLLAVAGNMMGVAADAALGRDAALELANVLCTHVLEAVFGRDKVFRPDAPRWCAGEEHFPLVAETRLRIAGGVIRVELRGRVAP